MYIHTNSYIHAIPLHSLVVMVKSMGPKSWSEECCNIALRNMDVSLIKTRVGGPHGRLEIEPSDYHTVSMRVSVCVCVTIPCPTGGWSSNLRATIQ